MSMLAGDSHKPDSDQKWGLSPAQEAAAYWLLGFAVAFAFAGVGWIVPLLYVIPIAAVAMALLAVAYIRLRRLVKLSPEEREAREMSAAVQR